MYHLYNGVGDHPNIPQEAFLFVPYRAQDPKQRDDYRIGSGEGIRRLMFEGWAEETFTPYEEEKLKQLNDYIQKKGLHFSEGWSRGWLLRWHLSTGCKVKKTIQDMRKFQVFQHSIRELSLTSNIAKFLNQGIYYMAGRDCHYRPILVFDVDKVMKLNMNDDEIIETQTYFFQYVVRNILIPGQVETWVSIIDAAYTSMISMVSTMKKSFTFLSETYRSRLFVNYIVRVPTSMSFLWSITKRFLEEETVKKINFFDQQIPEPLFQFCNPSQFEVKFGGTLPNIEKGQFWPPREWSKEYTLEKCPVKMLTKQQYIQFHNKKILYDTKIQEDLIYVPPTNTDLRENKEAQSMRHLERDFKRLLDTAQEDKAITFSLPTLKSLNYRDLVEKSKEMDGLLETVKR